MRTILPIAFLSVLLTSCSIKTSVTNHFISIDSLQVDVVRGLLEQEHHALHRLEYSPPTTTENIAEHVSAP